MIRIAIVEDEEACRSRLQENIRRFGEDQGIGFEVTAFPDGLDIAENYNPVWDIIFMDIKMKHMDGMRAARSIRKHDPAVIIIFITTMAQCAIEGYEVDALDFILKPLTYAQFSLKMCKAINMLHKREKKYLFLPVEDGKERVSADDILFIEVKNHNLHIVTWKHTYVMRCSLQEMEKELEQCSFVRCSHSYLVNLSNVAGVGKETVTVGTYELPVSRPKKKLFLQALSDYLGAGYL